MTAGRTHFPRRVVNTTTKRDWCAVVVLRDSMFRGTFFAAPQIASSTRIHVTFNGSAASHNQTKRSSHL
jgi:hypothetical protein